MDADGLSVQGGRDDLYEVRITGTVEQLDRLLRSQALDVGCCHPHFEFIADRSATLLVFAGMAQVEELKAGGYAVALGANVSQRAESRRADIGTGDRFEGGRIVPRGYGSVHREPGNGRQDSQR